MKPPEEYSFDFFVHEAGHVMAAHWMGATQCMVGYVLHSQQPFETRFNIADGRGRIKVSLAAILAEIAVAGDQVSQHRLNSAFKEIVFGHEDSCLNNLSSVERKYVSHAMIDFHVAIQYAKADRKTDDPQSIYGLLNREWDEVFQFVVREKQLLIAIAERMQHWYVNGLPSPLFDGIEAIARYQSKIKA
jgi:hypothetical protein